LPTGGLSLAAAMLALGLLGAATALTPALAEDSAVKTADYLAASGADSQVIQASYSTGASGHKLIWRPYQSDGSQTGDNPLPDAQAAEYQSPLPTAGGQTAGGPTGAANPFSDPFDDGKKVAQTPPGSLNEGRQAKSGMRGPAELDEPPSPGMAVPSPKGQSAERSQAIGGDGSLEKTLASAPEVSLGPCRTSADLKKINEISYNITPEAGGLPRECPLGGQYCVRRFAPMTFTWKASGLCHKPLYFEDEDLERYGHTWGPFLQPLLCGAHFFLSVPMLPYNMGLQPPCECIYTLGYYRPGDCAPYKIDPLPISVRAVMAETGFALGVNYFMPK
jgi:hypothetical protein